MPPVDDVSDTKDADVCLVLEGTYPYVAGGVSTWAHDLIRGLPALRFTLAHISPERGTQAVRRYALPDNVVGLRDLYCREPPPRGRTAVGLQRAIQAERRRLADPRRSSRVLDAFRRMHLEERADPKLLVDLATGDLSVGALLHGRASFDLTVELYERLAPEASFLDFFWHLRSMYLPLVRLLGAEPPSAATYHALCTGYAGILAAVWSHRTGRPLLLTEHGIYTRERHLELYGVAWSGRRHRSDRGESSPRVVRRLDAATASALRRMWVRFFRVLAQAAYAHASAITTVSETNRIKQIADGAPPEKTTTVPNGIDYGGLRRRLSGMRESGPEHRRVRVGFVGRVVPIKDVVTFIHACSLALRDADLDVRVFGPVDEDPAYLRRCRRLVANLGLERAIRFEGPQRLERIYSAIDVLVLTSFSEGQPLVILEANAAGIPVIATDVGACRELIEGGSDFDRRIGPSGIVTRIAAPEETAAAIVRLVREPELRRRMGAAGQRRVASFYRQTTTLSAYRAFYGGERWPVSAGVSSI